MGTCGAACLRRTTGGAVVDILHCVIPRRRVLIDWDYAASGIWTILTPEELRAPAPPGRRSGTSLPPSRPRAWADRLSGDLLDALEAWNRHGDTLYSGTEATQADRAAFWRQAADLAERVQDQLGPGYEVLHRTVDGAWKWVRPPW